VITTREIAAWRTVAPWATDMMVEQDYLLCRAVAAIFEDEFLSTQVAMRGVTVLLAIGQPYSPHDAYREFCAVFSASS
jgi:hypothetical protein